ncbi:hypothetical protein GCM10010116_40690 [Microbispora rosea subsp. aerata]|nr:hypothetical protein GCM10010116_40690 [Microbispora rosea subsp. aerata]GIH57194.1 hypothetical protein Mro02_41080 [Microbispora rosea subsp. aerata]GLJ84736.1 hypothetical protein GCM10017588_34640 [Microbispora rosea subsp. aerata]
MGPGEPFEYLAQRAAILTRGVGAALQIRHDTLKVTDARVTQISPAHRVYEQDTFGLLHPDASPMRVKRNQLGPTVPKPARDRWRNCRLSHSTLAGPIAGAR